MQKKKKKHTSTLYSIIYIYVYICVILRIIDILVCYDTNASEVGKMISKHDKIEVILIHFTDSKLWRFYQEGIYAP